MKYALMSDAHANPRALETALADARKQRCGKFLFLGDVTGYGYDAKKALEIVRKNFDVVLMGNHDSACVGLEPVWEVMVNQNYDLDREARERLSEKDLLWLRERDYLHEAPDFVCAHGDFTRPKSWNYVVGCEEAVRNFFSRTESLMFCGHTHQAAIWEQTRKGEFKAKLEGRFRNPAVKAESISFKMNGTSRYIVNVGSVGHPRHDLCSSYGIFDSETRRVTLRRLPFDFKNYIADMGENKVELPDWLCQLRQIASQVSQFCEDASERLVFSRPT